MTSKDMVIYKLAGLYKQHVAEFKKPEISIKRSVKRPLILKPMYSASLHLRPMYKICGEHDPSVESIAYPGDIRHRLTVFHFVSIVYWHISGVSFTWIPPWA